MRIFVAAPPALLEFESFAAWPPLGISSWERPTRLTSKG